MPARRGNRHPSIAPYETFRASDGFVNIAVGNDALWRALCAPSARRCAALADDARFATNAARVGAPRRARRHPRAARRRAHRRRTGSTLLRAAPAFPCGPILDVAPGAGAPAGAARDMVVPLAHPTAGDIRVTGVPVKLSETPGSVRTPPPRLGEHTRSALAELLGLDDAELAHLSQAGVVRTAPQS